MNREKHKDQKAVASKEFQAGRDLIEDEFAEENRVKVEIYVYYAKSIGMLMAVMAVIFYVSFLKLIHFLCKFTRFIKQVNNIHLS